MEGPGQVKMHAFVHFEYSYLWCKIFDLPKKAKKMTGSWDLTWAMSEMFVSQTQSTLQHHHRALPEGTLHRKCVAVLCWWCGARYASATHDALAACALRSVRWQAHMMDPCPMTSLHRRIQFVSVRPPVDNRGLQTGCQGLQHPRSRRPSVMGLGKMHLSAVRHRFAMSYVLPGTVPHRTNATRCCVKGLSSSGAMGPLRVHERTGRARQSFLDSPASPPPFPPFFCARVGDPREGRGDVAIPPTRGPPRRQGLGREEGEMFGGEAL